MTWSVHFPVKTLQQAFVLKIETVRKKNGSNRKHKELTVSARCNYCGHTIECVGSEKKPLKRLRQSMMTAHLKECKNVNSRQRFV